MLVCGLAVAACGGTGSNNSTTNYYSAGYDYYYQIVASESGTPTTLNVLTSLGTPKFSASLESTQVQNQYTFTTQYNNQTLTGSLVLESSILAMVVLPTSVWGADLASSNPTPLSAGSYSTLCDVGANLPPCTITINQNLNSISISEFASSGTVQLCSDSTLLANGNIPNSYSFRCGGSGSQGDYPWYLTSVSINGIPGLLMSEPNFNASQNKDTTSSIAYPVALDSTTFVPVGNFYYVNDSDASAVIGNANFNSTILGIYMNGVQNCNSNSCLIMLNQYYLNQPILGNGYAYFNNNQGGSSSYVNLVGNTLTGLAMDNAGGFYIQYGL